jgi:integrase
MREYRLVCYRKIWCAYWREDGKARRDSLGTRDPVAAERKFAAYVTARNTAPRPSVVTVADCLAAYYEAKPQVIPRPALGKFFGLMLPDAIDEDTCKKYPAQRQAAIKTIHTEMGILRAALIHAQRKKWIVAPFIWMPQNGEPRDRWLTQDEAQRLLAACEHPHLRLYVLLALRTAARPGAILGLTWPQVSFDMNRIDFRIPGKAQTKKGRAVVPITPDLRQALEAAQESKGPHDTFVVCWGGDRVKTVKRAFAAACKRAGLHAVTPNVLRHTAATWMAESGVDMRKISRYLGHTKTDTTEVVYAKHTPEFLKDAADALAQRSLVQSEHDAVNVKATQGKTDRRMSAKDRK